MMSDFAVVSRSGATRKRNMERHDTALVRRRWHDVVTAHKTRCSDIQVSPSR